MCVLYWIYSTLESLRRMFSAAIAHIDRDSIAMIKLTAMGKCLDIQQRVLALGYGNELPERNPCLGGAKTAVKGLGLKPELSLDTRDWRKRTKEASRGRRSRTVTCLREDLTGKNVVVVGLGASGRAAVKLALARGANVVAADIKSSTPPIEISLISSYCRNKQNSVLTYQAYENDVDSAVATRLRVELGPHKRETFHGASLLVLSPGVSVEQPDIASAIGENVPAISELSFAAEALPQSINVAAVSGTNGKSTVTTFAGQLLRRAGVRTFVGGNLGTPLSEAAVQCLAFPEEDPPFQAAVVEVSSYQMELPGLFCPKVAAILNLTPDHLERHKTMEIYGMLKCRLFAQMDSSSLAIVPHSIDLEILVQHISTSAHSFLRKLAVQSGGQGTRAWLGGLPGVQLDSQARRAFVMVPTTGAQAGLYLSSLKTVGSHNAHNAGTAALIALALDVGLDEETIQAAIPNLQPPPHRMEIVYQDKLGILWVNDSKATNIDATSTGLKGIIGRKAVVLLGGLAKVLGAGNLGFDRVVDILNSHRATILFGASGEQIEKELRDAGIAVLCLRTASMKDAVALARTVVKPGDAVILSPACSSFDEFQNFEHRGQVFSDLAKMSITHD